MTNLTQSQAARELLNRRKAGKTLLDFVQYRNTAYQAARHHRLICDKLEAVERGEIKRLMLFLPPRHGKSELASRNFPAWALGCSPARQIITASYSDEIASDFGRDVRNIVADPLYQNVFKAISLRPDSKSANRWHTSAGGIYFAAGVGSAITGRGADILLIDDPIKNRQEADSQLVRDRVWNWYTSTAYTRLMPGAAIVLIQTRWHVDDLAGRLIKQMEGGGEQWEIVSLAAETDGEALWPEWYPMATLDTIKATIGPRDWSALYQQQPMPDGGGEFKKDYMQYYTGKIDSKRTNNYILCDPAGEKKKTSDYTTFWVIGLNSDQNYYVHDLVRDRLNLVERADTLFRLHRQYRPLQVRYEKYGMMADIEHIKSRMNTENYRFPITEVAGQTPKNDRIRRLLPLFDARRVWFPETLIHTDHRGVPVDLIKTFREEEFAAFPVGVHDDMMDSLSRIAEPDLALVWPAEKKKVITYDNVMYAPEGQGWMA